MPIDGLYDSDWIADHPDDLPYIPTPENPWDWEPVHVLSVDDDHPVLLVGRTRITCVDPLCGLRA
ncbi:hypothetical protein [Nocardiopsis valliformis]|uniref:hypothetical protein n=1 Tax=Nocardiopsis valliformis TaxID=239974 RepID=UPI00034A34F2|nr:hypothetical protein [Nocardiopsis valliformis]